MMAVTLIARMVYLGRFGGPCGGDFAVCGAQ